MATQTDQLTNKLAEKLAKDIPEESEYLYKGVYKDGPNRREQVFRFKTATADRFKRDKEAWAIFNRYVSFLASQNNSKFMMIGNPMSFAVDVDEEIAYLKQKRLREKDLAS